MEAAAEICIGSNPDTNELEIDSILDVLKNRHRRFVVKGVFDGYWRGFVEDTFVVLVIDFEDNIAETVDVLEKKLNKAPIVVVAAGDI